MPRCLISPNGTGMKNVSLITTGAGGLNTNVTHPQPESRAGGNSTSPEAGGDTKARADAGGNARQKDEEIDEGRQQANGWVRLHRRPCKALLITSTGPDISGLSGRITKFHFESSNRYLRHNNWDDEKPANQEQSEKWTGYILFPFKKTTASNLCRPCSPVKTKHNMITHFPKDPLCEICQKVRL